MVFISTYRSTRIVPRNFLQRPVMRVRALADYYSQRPWNGSLSWFIPGEMRFWAAGIPLIYFVHRWHNDHTLEIDNIEKSLIKRWGTTLDEVRKLSPEDQLRARIFVDIERLYSAYGSKDIYIQAPGDTLPGKNFYGNQNEHAH